MVDFESRKLGSEPTPAYLHFGRTTEWDCPSTNSQGNQIIQKISRRMLWIWKRVIVFFFTMAIFDQFGAQKGQKFKSKTLRLLPPNIQLHLPMKELREKQAASLKRGKQSWAGWWCYHNRSASLKPLWLCYIWFFIPAAACFFENLISASVRGSSRIFLSLPT